MVIFFTYLQNHLVFVSSTSRIMIDEDDEVRDRAAFYHYILSHNQVALKSAYLLSEEMHLSPSGLERALLDYVHNSHTVAGSPFSLATVPIADIVQPNDLSSAIESDVVKIKGKQIWLMCINNNPREYSIKN